MMVRDAHRAGVVVQPFVERADLRGTVLLTDRAAADREHSAARSRTRLEDLAGIAKLSELVRYGEPGDSRSDNDHANRGDLAAEVEPLLRRRRKQAECGHRLVRHARAAGRGDMLEKLASRKHIRALLTVTGAAYS